jgi:Spy/CpxP family protein refolding chaperone
MKLFRNAALGVVAGATVFVAYQTAALSQNDPPQSGEEQGHRPWGEHGGQMWHHGGRHDDGFGMGMDGGFGPALRQLDLTDEQRKSVHDIVDQARPDMQKIHEQMRNLLENFRRTLPDDPKYSAVIAQTTRDSQQLAASMVKEASELRTKIYGVLTKEQKARLPELMKDMGGHHKMREGRPGPEGESS